MPRAVLLADFGSTYTKLAAVSVSPPALLGAAAARTTLNDISEGYSAATKALELRTGRLEVAERYACSSAAGGLRMAVSGLVGSLTEKAARLACLGAGARVVSSYSHHLTGMDLEEIRRVNPDIMLLAGGTDGGNSECILYNAAALAGLGADFPVVISGNREAAGLCRAILESGGMEVYVTANIMPDFASLNLSEAQSVIRDIFLKRIIFAKGIAGVREMAGGILMPTPAAVLTALELLSESVGELVAVDVGGATTDVYSIADGVSNAANRVLRGIIEPRIKRTVEGDMGLRHSAAGVVEAVGAERVCSMSGLEPQSVAELADKYERGPDKLPVSEEERALDFALASLCVETSFSRHSGRLERVFTPAGMVFSQTGKDLTGVTTLVATGGPLINTERLRQILGGALYDSSVPEVLNPVRADIYLDKSYILSAMGLLAQSHPEAALEIMRKELVFCGTLEQKTFG